MTVFIFTEKAEGVLSDTQGNIFIEVIFIIGVFAYFFYKAFLMVSKKNRSTTGLAMAGIFLAIILFSSWAKEDFRQRENLNNEYSKLLSIYQNQEYKTTEGTVSVLHLEPEGGHDAGDIIKIDGIEFELSCFNGATFEYNKTIVYGGVLTEGTFARVFYYQTEDPSRRGKIILRIDLLEQTTSPTIKLDPYLPCAG